MGFPPPPRYPVKYKGYTMESANHITCGTPKPLAEDWVTPQEAYANSTQGPVPDILSRMDDWDEKYKAIFGEYPTFSRLYVTAKGDKPKYTTYEEVQADPNGDYVVLYDPHDLTPRYIKRGRKDAF